MSELENQPPLDASRRAETLRLASERYQQLVDALPLPVLRIDRDGRVLEANREALRVLAREDLGLVGHSLHEHELGDYLDLDDLVREVLRDGQPQRRELELTRADGATTVLDAQAVPEPAPDAVNRSVLVAAVDITEATFASQRLAEVQRLESIGELARGLAHDFNNLLQAILGHATLLAADLDPGPNRASAEAIATAAGRAAGLVGQLQAYAGQRPVARTPLELRALAREATKLAIAGVDPNLEIVVERGPAVWVEGDPSQLNQVLLNLVVNAADAIGHNAGRIDLRVTEELAAPGRWVPSLPDRSRPVAMLEVRDSGPGMTDDVRQRVFEPFFSTKGTGRGLGMAVVLGIVRAHGGAIMLENLEPHGTVVRLALPLLAHPMPAGVGDEVSDTASPGRRVLVVDDDAPVAHATSMMLEHLGYQTSVVASGSEALERWRTEGPFDLVLCDVSMKGMGGMETWRALDEIAPGVRLVLASGHAAAELAALHLPDGRGPAATLSKPFSIASLAQAVETALAP